MHDALEPYSNYSGFPRIFNEDGPLKNFIYFINKKQFIYAI